MGQAFRRAYLRVRHIRPMQSAFLTQCSAPNWANFRAVCCSDALQLVMQLGLVMQRSFAAPQATPAAASGVTEINVEQLEQVAIPTLRQQLLQTTDQVQHHEPLPVTTTRSARCNLLYLEHQQASKVHLVLHMQSSES